MSCAVLLEGMDEEPEESERVTFGVSECGERDLGDWGTFVELQPSFGIPRMRG